jgi:hypothetical protein
VAQRTPPLLVARILWASLLFSLGMYAFVLTQLPRPDGALPAAPLPPLLLWPLSGVLALTSLVVVPIWGRSMQRQAVLRSPARPELAATQAYFTSLILRLAVAEAIAVLGMVNALSQASLAMYVPSGALAAVIMLWHFPTQTRAAGR